VRSSSPIPKVYNIDQFESYLNAYGLKSFTVSRFYEIFENERVEWGIKKSYTFLEVLDHLIKDKILFQAIAIDPTGQEKIVLTHRKRDEFTAMTALLKNSYFAYRTAMEIHQLCSGKAKLLYLNAEHTKDRGISILGNELTQESIAEAFQNRQRTNKNLWQWNRKELMLTNGKKTDRLGVICIDNEHSKYSYTDLERTLIDIVVRPLYGGGASAVLKAFKRAKSTVKLNILEDYLKKLNYIYPYHQSIGYYMEKAGYQKDDFERFNKRKIFDFYLAHGIEYPEYNEKWRLYVPDAI
jgi:hypothetical protein